MNNNIYRNPQFTPSQSTAPPEILPSNASQSQYSNYILKRNVGKFVVAYFSYSDSIDWRDKMYLGILEEAGKDYIVINDQKEDKWYLLQTIYLNYIEFNEKINY